MCGKKTWLQQVTSTLTCGDRKGKEPIKEKKERKENGLAVGWRR